MTSATGAQTMFDDLPPIPGGPWGGLGVLTGAVVAGFLWLRKFLSRDATERAADGAEKTVIDMLRQQLQLERERNNQLMQSNDALSQQIGQLREQVSELSAQVRSLKSQLERSTTPAGTP